jgi:hypothetical protein
MQGDFLVSNRVEGLKEEMKRENVGSAVTDD